ncbi:hypothetical protein AAMO2058_001266700 [Amorphochlora amoebiformis]
MRRARTKRSRLGGALIGFWMIIALTGSIWIHGTEASHRVGYGFVKRIHFNPRNKKPYKGGSRYTTECIKGHELDVSPEVIDVSFKSPWAVVCVGLPILGILRNIARFAYQQIVNRDSPRVFVRYYDKKHGRRVCRYRYEWRIKKNAGYHMAEVECSVTGNVLHVPYRTLKFTWGIANDILWDSASGNLPMLRKVVAKFDPKERERICDPYGRTPIYLALLRNQTEIVEYLCTQGFNVNLKPIKSQMSPLYLAIKRRDKRAAVALIRSGAYVEYSNAFEMGATPLALAAKMGQADIVRELVEHQAHVNVKIKGKFPILHDAIRNRSLSVVRILLKHGADPNSRANEQGVEASASMVAAKLGATDILRALIFYKANVNATTHQGASALFYGVEEGDLESTEILLRANSNPDIPFIQKQRANEKMMKIVEKYGGLPPVLRANTTQPKTKPPKPPFLDEEQGEGQQQEEGQHPGEGEEMRNLHRKPKNRRPRIGPFQYLQWAQSQRANGSLKEEGKEKEDNGGCDIIVSITPLMLACRNKRKDIVKALLEGGANPSYGSGLGSCPLLIAASTGDYDMCRMLLEHKADPESHDFVGQTASGVAFTRGHATLGRYLASLERDCVKTRLAEGKGHPRDKFLPSQGHAKTRDSAEQKQDNNRRRSNGGRIEELPDIDTEEIDASGPRPVRTSSGSRPLPTTNEWLEVIDVED